MELDLDIGNILGHIDSLSGLFDFHTELQQCALHCANGSVLFRDEWHSLLSGLLCHWDAEIRMNLYEAVDYMADVCGFTTIGSDNFFSCNYGFWFILSDEYKKLGINESKTNGFYYMTIAIFETINYWCWHDSPIPITFDFPGLQQVLKFGNVHIDWSSYKKVESDDSFQSECLSLLI